MKAEVYERVVSVSGSLAVGALLFGLGVLVGFLLWGNRRKSIEQQSSGEGSAEAEAE